MFIKICGALGTKTKPEFKMKLREVVKSTLPRRQWSNTTITYFSQECTDLNGESVVIIEITAPDRQNRQMRDILQALESVHWSHYLGTKVTVRAVEERLIASKSTGL